MPAISSGGRPTWCGRPARRRGAPHGVVVTIAKRIPMQAGLGGGSSDGAAAIRALAALWRVRLSRARRHGLAAAMGADVPYFLEGGTALGRNRGDRLSRLADRPRAWVVLTVPALASARGRRSRGGTRGGQAGQAGQAGRAGQARPGLLERSAAGCRPTSSDRGDAGGGSRTGGRTSGVALGQRVGRFRPLRPPLSGRAGRARARRGAPRRLVLVTRTLTRRECAALAAK